jgi:post-segregation antitoxin (ccd killing protein)
MFVIRLPNGHLLAPESAMDHDGQVVGDAYVEVSPADPEYARLASQAISEEDMDRRRRRWREEDEALRREFEEYLANGGRDAGPGGNPGA